MSNANQQPQGKVVAHLTMKEVVQLAKADTIIFTINRASKAAILGQLCDLAEGAQLAYAATWCKIKAAHGVSEDTRCGVDYDTGELSLVEEDGDEPVLR